ncbi:MAG: 3-hydroxyacyl-CoA dehydrogenase/enoyl-CoA hydratase family protein [Firmicutes bacterium]|nr:3-hydroxyacyl-CoA dehydrogenase/enoyl-CoA hydratase family protein [Bacillota bacterium]
MIRKVAILGSGTMGSGIAAHLANAGIRSYLLDIVPNELLDEEKSKGLTLESPAVRNRIAANNKQQFVLKSRPAVIMDKADADLITVGNMEDNLAWLSECDWVVEVVPERLDIKKQVLKKIQPFIKPGTIVSTNTSGISVNSIVEDMPPEFKKYWLGTHFFNPVRYMKLLEIIPGNETLPEIVKFMSDFGEKILGKGIVMCKDTPNFIANRIGASLGASVIKLMMEYGLTVSEADALTGTAIGRPGTGTFALYDMVGLDIGILSATVVHDNVTDPEEKKNFTFPPFIYQMLDKKMLGAKTKGGFYKKQGKEKFMIDINTLEYVPPKPTEYASFAAAKEQKTLAGKLEAFFSGDDAAARFVWEHMKYYFVYATSKVPEISDNILNVDRAIKWGYNHTVGPFEVWGGLDLDKYVARMEAEGSQVADWVKKMLASGIKSFYKSEGGVDYYYSLQENKYLPIPVDPGFIVLKDLKAKNKVVKESKAATLYDIGDGVLCFEIHTKNSAISTALVDFMREAREELERNWDGMVITGSGRNFCVGADLTEILPYIQAKKWAEADEALKKTQYVYMDNKYSLKPVVVAPYGMALGGGCEMVLHGSAVQAAGELYMGLVEVGVGVIPAGGGVKEMTVRALDRIKGTTAFAVDFIIPYLQNIGTAKVSMSAKEAVKLGYMKPSDGITLSSDLLIADAKKKVIEMIEKNYSPPAPKAFAAPGRNNTSLARMGVKVMQDAGMVSEYDMHIFDQIVFIMSGGNATAGTMINEYYLLDLEREAFINLCKEQKTQDRIKHMLTTGKPLRN